MRGASEAQVSYYPTFSRYLLLVADLHKHIDKLQRPTSARRYPFNISMIFRLGFALAFLHHVALLRGLSLPASPLTANLTSDHLNT